VPARLHALHHKRVRARLLRGGRLRFSGDRDPQRAAGVVQRLDRRGGRQAEGHRDHRRALLGQQRELLVPAVVAVDRVAQLHPVALRLALQRRGIGVERAAVGERRAGHDQVDPERPLSEAPQFADVLAQRRGAAIPRREEAQPSGLRHGAGKRGRGGAAAHRRLDDRMLEL
jgi:hypothetical protein